MQSLVVNRNGTPATSQAILVNNTQNSDKSIQQLIRTHKEALEKFGEIGFTSETIKGKTGSTKKKNYYLNEQQSYLFITFLKNSKEVVEFKIKLIEEFFKMKQELHAQDTDYKKLVLTQNTTIALLQKQLESKPKQITQKPKKHPMSYLSPVEHNTFLELVFQMIEQKRDISNFKKVLTKRENNMQNFLNSFENRYPEVKSYIERYNT